MRFGSAEESQSALARVGWLEISLRPDSPWPFFSAADYSEWKLNLNKDELLDGTKRPIFWPTQFSCLTFSRQNNRTLVHLTSQPASQLAGQSTSPPIKHFRTPPWPLPVRLGHLSRRFFVVASSAFNGENNYPHLCKLARLCLGYR